jgi:hypothetical protein
MKKKSKKEKDYLSMTDNRYGLFMSDSSYELEIMYGREYLKSDVVNSIILYRINILDTEVDDLYGETKPSEKKYFPPIRVNGLVTIESSRQQYFPGSQITRDDSGVLVFKVFIRELEELDVDINRGDIVAYNISGEQERYYEVTNANNIVDSTDKTILGARPFWRVITALPVKGDVVNFI